MKYINMKKIKELMEKKVVLTRLSSFALAGVILLSSCGSKSNSEIEVNDLPDATIETEMGQEKPQKYTIEDKVSYVNEHYKDFMNEVNTIEGISLDENAAKLQLSFINGLRPEQTNVITNDYVLDFISDYENIWNKLTVDTINNLVNDIAITSRGIYGNAYGNYILDNEDKESYEYFANKTLEIVKLVLEGQKEIAKRKAIDKNRLNVEVLLLDNSFENKDINNVSEEVQYMIRYLAFLDTHFLEEKSKVTVDTKIGTQDFINYDDSTTIKHYSKDDASYSITGNIGNDISYFMERDSVNVTMKYWLGPNLCSSLNNNSKVRVRV